MRTIRVPFRQRPASARDPVQFAGVSKIHGLNEDAGRGCFVPMPFVIGFI